MPKLDPGIRKTLRRAIAKARRYAPEYGRGHLSEAAFWLLLDSAKLTVSFAPIRPAKILTPTLDGARALVLREGLQLASSRFLILAEVARQWLGAYAHGRLVGDLFAAVGLRPELASDDVAALREIDGRWFDTYWEHLYSTAGAALRADERPAARDLGGHASPEELYYLGRQAREGSNYPMAAALYLEASRAAVCSGDWPTVVRARQGLSTLHLRQADTSSARRWARRALRAAVDYRAADLVGPALHDLFAVEAEAGRDHAALEYAARALDAYGPENPHFLAFAHDLSWYFVDRGLYLPAVGLQRSILPLITEPESRIRALGNALVAAGGAGDVAAFDLCHLDLRALLLSHASTDAVPRGYLSIAFGALHIGRWDAAAAAAKCAFEEAGTRGQVEVRRKAEIALDAAAASVGFPLPSAPLPGYLLEGWHQLVERMLRRVHQLNAVTASDAG